MDVTTLSTSDLLRLHAGIADELLRREITRTLNNPTGDLAEHLFRAAFRWTPTANSHSNVDAIGPDGSKYQIKGRRCTGRNGSSQLGAIRDLSAGHFDFLAAVLFEADFGVLRAAIIPFSIVKAKATFVTRTNSSKFMLSESIWGESGVKDVTAQLKAVIL